MKIIITKIIRLQIDPVNIIYPSPKSNSKNKYLTFISGSLLIISETLPYFQSINGNGIIHTFTNILKEYKDDFK